LGAAHLPGHGAPQIHRWLDAAADGLVLVHHQSILEQLPTFNSFAILSALYRIECLSERFLYVEDDMLFDAPVRAGDFLHDDGTLRLYPRLGLTCSPTDENRTSLSP